MKTCKNLEIISDKKKRVGSQTRRTTTAAYIYIYIYIYKQKIPLERTTIGSLPLAIIDGITANSGRNFSSKCFMLVFYRL